MAAGFRCTLGDFSADRALHALGQLISGAARAGYSTHHTAQVEAWQRELELLESMAAELRRLYPASVNWSALLEYDIPRRQKRPDMILIADDLIIVIEFKVGAVRLSRADAWQVESYALDLRDFHAASSGRTIAPIAIATAAVESPTHVRSMAVFQPHNFIAPVQRVSASDLASAIVGAHQILHNSAADPIDVNAWEEAAYRPALSIIEAAEALFRQHSVANISHAFAHNLSATSGAIVQAMIESQRLGQRTICFVTGSPGAGKTLAGLDAVHDPALREAGRPSSVFLSGNGPLVKIIREALTRDRQRTGHSRRGASREVATFIQNVHAFLREYGIGRPNDPPHENAIVFDEAQRAWDQQALERQQGIKKSEPQLILEIMSRAPGWCTVVAVVGGGQEIHRGEAGLAEWGRALNGASCPWTVIVSCEALQGGEAVAGQRLFEQPPSSHLRIVESSEMHLTESVRSPRARLLGEWVNELLTQPGTCAIATDQQEFPIVLTRSLGEARQWLSDRGRGERRFGLLASSGALRLRAFGVELSSGFRKGYDYTDWFLNPHADVRASMQLEVAATEFECQGLELDWTCVCWGGDFLVDPVSESWHYRAFRGSRWQNVSQRQAQTYIANKYRVLLTRAREGMVIWVPKDSPHHSRDAGFQTTADTLHRAGIAYL